MAEIFGAVASGAGLVSLSMQLLETSQKLKAFYNASKDAPDFIADLCFELKTMSLSLRQLEPYRQKDALGDEVLGRCVQTCERKVAKICNTVTKIETLSRKTKWHGRVYVAFKEPEIEKQLQELERAKSALVLAHMQFCGFWNAREAEKHTSLLIAQSALLSCHDDHIQSLERAVEKGDAAIMKRLNASPAEIAQDEDPFDDSVPRIEAFRSLPISRASQTKAVRAVRVSLPHMFLKHVWEFSLQGHDGGWRFQLRPVVHRPLPELWLKVLETGNIPAARKLLWLQSIGHVASSDNTSTSELDVYSPQGALEVIKIACELREYALCASLLHALSTCVTSEDLSMVFFQKVVSGIFGDENPSKQQHQELRDLCRLFLSKVQLRFGQIKFEQPGFLSIRQRVNDNDVILDTIYSDKSLMAFTVPLRQRFLHAMDSVYWPAKTFSAFIGVETTSEVVHWRDADGRTALHWAAEHFAVLAQENDIDTTASYLELVRMLLQQGADVHATSSRGETPLLGMILHPQKTWNRQVVRFSTTWTLHDLSSATRQWGLVVVEAGITLDDYVATENELYKTSGKERLVQLRRFGFDHEFENDLRFMLHGFETRRSGGLWLAGKQRRRVRLWEETSPPGSWAEAAVKSRVCWNPEETYLDTSYVWHEIPPVYIFSPGLVTSPIDSETDPFWKEAYSARREMLEGTQDDNGSIMMAIMQNLGPSQHHAIRRNRRRAMSVPRAGCKTAQDRTIWVSEFRVHKCPLDGKWKALLGWSKWWSCIHGECCSDQRYNGGKRFCHWHTDPWFSGLLKYDTRHDVVQRFVKKFFPGSIPEVEAHLNSLREQVYWDKKIEELT